MPNLINCIGYANGKLHTGLIAYLCALHNDGEREPLASFFNALDATPPEGAVKARREYKGIDLYIEVSGKPYVAIEMKVDDREGRTKSRRAGKMLPQTQVYSRRFSTCERLFFVTLGTGEFYGPPSALKLEDGGGDRGFEWIRLPKFARAVSAIQYEDNAIHDWKSALAEEVAFREAVRAGDLSQRGLRRKGSWNLTLLAHLRDRLAKRPDLRSMVRDARVYPYGARPDTLLNFGTDEGYTYLEIPFNGKLCLKAGLWRTRKEAWPETAKEQTDYWRRVLSHVPHTVTGNRLGRSKTLLWMDVGIRNEEGFLRIDDVDDVANRVGRILTEFQSARPEAPMPPANA